MGVAPIRVERLTSQPQWLVPPATLVAGWAVKAWIERTIERRFRDWEVRFSTFHVRLVDAMELIRRVLAEANAAITSYQAYAFSSWGVKGNDEMEAALDGLHKASFELQCRQFYFDGDTRRVIERVVDLLTRTVGDARAVFLSGGRDQPQEVTDFAARIEKRSKDLRDAEKELDGRFRAIVRGEFEPTD